MFYILLVLFPNSKRERETDESNFDSIHYSFDDVITSIVNLELLFFLFTILTYYLPVYFDEF